ncbi:hypothetical protein NUW58_g9961 [Xylaria curta]|uniref:Uncharacterized protein n=1 Tax=Xylaria curta TaxID=42375 RepID=A0ACC1MRV2_9PEZI|nr:hypothetical protein NUW58_g9961 [Xylaria curta]
MGESRQELVAWLNSLLQLNITKVEQCGTGPLACLFFITPPPPQPQGHHSRADKPLASTLHLLPLSLLSVFAGTLIHCVVLPTLLLRRFWATTVFDSIFLDVPMSRVKFNVNGEWAYVQNFKILQSQSRRPSPASASISTPPQACADSCTDDNLEFLHGPRSFGTSISRAETTMPSREEKEAPSPQPVPALETHSDDVVMLDDVRADDVAVVSQISPLAPISVPFDYLRVILNHSSAHGRPLTFEYLSRFELRSRPSESLASILLQTLSTAGDPHDPTRLPIQFCLEVIRLWDACRAEGCLAPITELVSLVSFTMQLQTVAFAPYVAPTLLPVAMDSCYEALGCATSEPTSGGVSSPAVDFWSLVHMHFVLLYLNRKQPIDDFVVVLKLLCTSHLDPPHGDAPMGRGRDEGAGCAARGAPGALGVCTVSVRTRAPRQARLDHPAAGDTAIELRRWTLRRRHAVLVGGLGRGDGRAAEAGGAHGVSYST